MLTFLFLLLVGHSFAQSPAEVAVLNVSKQIFDWEVADKVDSLERAFDERFVVVGGKVLAMYATVP